MIELEKHIQHLYRKHRNESRLTYGTRVQKPETSPKRVRISLKRKGWILERAVVTSRTRGTFVKVEVRDDAPSGRRVGRNRPLKS